MLFAYWNCRKSERSGAVQAPFSMPILDPSTAHENISGRIAQKTLGPIPGGSLRFGYVIDETPLKPGDIILCAPIHSDSTWFAKISYWLISKFQSIAAKDGDSSWSHVAIYVGRGRIVEAAPFVGVWQAPIYNYVPGYRLRFRRFDTTIAEEDTIGFEIALGAALEISNSRYAIFQVLKIVAPFIRKIDRFLHRIFPSIKEKNHICSTLYSQQVFKATNDYIVDEKQIIEGLPVMPAQLANSPRLRDVDVGWVEIVKNVE